LNLAPVASITFGVIEFKQSIDLVPDVSEDSEDLNSVIDIVSANKGEEILYLKTNKGPIDFTVLFGTQKIKTQIEKILKKRIK